jgi:tetratricopeptide (TPR) repeat protein
MFSIPLHALACAAALGLPQDSAPAPRDPRATAEALERAGAHELVGDFPQAARILESLLEKDPGNVLLRWKAGILLSRSEAHDAADAHLTKAAELDPKDRELWLSLGEVRYVGQRYHPAIAAFDMAAALGDADARARNGKGAALFALGETDAAKALLTEAAAANPRLPGARFTLGRIALDSGDLTEALTRFEECIRLDARDAEAWFRKGLTLRRLGRPADAEAAFRTVLELDPTHAGARLNLGQVLLSIGKEAEGRAEIENHGKLARGQQRLTFAMNSLRLDARSPSSRVAVGEALLDLGLASDALVQFLEATRAKKPPASAFLGAARACKVLGKAPQAAKHARKALDAMEADPKSSPKDLAEARELAGGGESRPSK